MSYEAADHIQELVSNTGISRIILVDDDYEDDMSGCGIGLPAVIDALESNRKNGSVMDRIKGLDLAEYDVELFEPDESLVNNELLVNTLTDHWDGGVPQETKEELFNALDLRDTREETSGAIDSLSSMLKGTVKVKTMSVSEWRDNSASLFAQDFKEGEFVLVLFDLKLRNVDTSRIGIGRSDKAGYTLVKRSLEQGNSHIIPGIMTNEAHTREEEMALSDEQLRQGIASAVITKQRFKSKREMVRGLEMVATAHVLYEMEQEAERAFQDVVKSKAWGGTVELCALAGMAKEAEREGCHLSESLLRFMLHRSNDTLSFKVRESCRHNAAIRMLNKLDGGWFGGLPDNNAMRELDKIPLLYKDAYISGKNLAKHRMPTNLGDIYQINKPDNPDDCYILLQQPCNISVRSGGERKTGEQDFVLAKIIGGKENHRDSQSGPLPVPFAPIERGGETSLAGETQCRVSFKSYIHMPPWALDLCVYDGDGESRSIEEDDLVDGPIERGWQAYGRAMFEDLTRRVSEYQSILESASIAEQSQAAKYLELAVFGLPNIGWDIECDEDGRIRFGIRRIARLRDNIAQGILNDFARYQSRAAYPSKLL
ncbi:hypothetical protein [Olsenella uli]|uniref:hypothetical protein n=1 Tax=Olsenella uli TaxID=133926 RepID=UPI00325FBCF2